MSRPKLTALVTGELAGSPRLLINATQSHDYLKQRNLLPYGYRESITLSDGTITDGVLKPVPIWYIETSEARIVVDTSFESVDGVTEMRDRCGYPCYMRRPPEWEIPAALAKVGARPQDIDIVILTHCHYDHCGSNDLFTRAQFYAHAKEMELALSPPPYAQHYHAENAARLQNIEDRLTLIGDEQVITTGVSTWRAGGHSPGSVVVMIESDKGPVAIMGDVMHDYLNLEHWWPGPSNNYWCIDELVRAYARVREEAHIVLPGHDWKLWNLYPGGRIL